MKSLVPLALLRISRNVYGEGWLRRTGQTMDTSQDSFSLVGLSCSIRFLINSSPPPPPLGQSSKVQSAV